MERNRALWRDAGAGLALICLLAHLRGSPGIAEEQSSAHASAERVELISFVVEFGRSGLSAEGLAEQSQAELRELTQVTVGEPETRRIRPVSIQVTASGVLFKLPRHELTGASVVTFALGRSYCTTVQFTSENYWRSSSYGVEALRCSTYSRRNVPLRLEGARYASECFPAGRPSRSRATAIRALLGQLGESADAVAAYCPTTAGCHGGTTAGCDIEAISSAAGTDDFILTLEPHGCSSGQLRYLVTREPGRAGKLLRYDLRCGCFGRW